MKVTVKTLDSGSKELEVSEELTVEKLKDEILKVMSIPLHQQRLIFQGKPLKDEMKLKDCGVADRVIHLVKRPPPSVTQETQESASTEATPASSADTVVTESTQTILLPGGMPSHTTLTQVTQNIVDRIVSSLTSHGADAEVSAETITTDAMGTTRRATVSARSDNFSSTAPPTSQPIENTTTTAITSGNAGTSGAEKSPSKMEVDEKSLEPSTAATSVSASGSSSFVTAEEDAKEKASGEPAEEDEATRDARRRRNRSKNHTLYNHAKTVKRCLDFAARVLNRYDRGSARVKAKIASEKTGETSEGVPVESWPEVEPMDVMESLDGPSDEAKAGAGPESGSDTEITGTPQNLGAAKIFVLKKERKSRRPKEPLGERYAILEDADMPDIPAQFYGVLMEDMQAVYRRLSPLMDDYQRNANEDRELTEAESVLAAQVALTVRDTIYYIGHGNVSLARLHLNFLHPPPRPLHLAAPHKTEVRRVMMSMRRCFPSMQRMHEPSGYIVDISRDNEGPGGGQTSGDRRTTRAVVNRSNLNVGGGMPGYGGMFGPMLGGILGGRRRFMESAQHLSSQSGPAPTAVPSGESGSAQPAAPQRKGSALKPKPENEKRFAVELKSADDVMSREPTEAMKKMESGYNEGWEELSEEEVKKRERRNKRMEEQRVMRDEIAEDHYHKDVEDKKKEDDKWRKQQEEQEKKRVEEEEARERKRKQEEEERKKKEDEERRKREEEEEEARKREEEARKGEEEARKASAKAGDTQEGGAVAMEGEESKPAGEGEGKKDDETPRYLARLLSELITGVADPAGPHRPSQPKSGTEGEEEEEEEEKPGTAPDTSSAGAAGQGESGEGEKKEEGDAPPRKSFAERYAGPEGTTVTIQAAPTAPFGLPMEGPSLSIRNPGAGAEPEMTINFPVPPAIHLLQSLLERAEERHRERQANGESSSSSSSDEDGDDEGEGGPVGRGASSEGGDKKKKKKARPHVPRPFVDDDGEVGSTSEAGEMDSMDTDKEGPAEFTDRSMAAGEHMTMLEAMREVRGKIGMNPECESEDEEERHVSMLEQFLKMISRELKVREVMKIMKGDVGCLERTQPNFQEFIRNKLLDGGDATKEKKDQAVCRFLEHVQLSMEAIEDSLPVRETGMDIVETVCKLLYHVLDELYDHIVESCTLREQINKVFAKRLQKWAKESTQLFACVMRHCVDGDHLFDAIISKMVAQLFPPSTPTNILHVCIDSILKWLDKARREAKYDALELDRYVCWREGCKSTPNFSYPLSMYVKEGMPAHDRLVVPYPPKESCPGGGDEEEEEEEATAASSGNGVPAGVPEEWVSTINHDSEAHPKREGAQQPYSDAYLSGMPAKKRKQLDTSDPCTMSTQDFVYEAMEYAISRAGATTTSGNTDAQMLSQVHHCPFIAGGLTANVHECHRERLEAAGATPEQYPHAMEFYHLDPKTHQERLEK